MIEIRPSAGASPEPVASNAQYELAEALLHLATLAVFAIPGAEGAGVTLVEGNHLTPPTVASIDFVRTVDAVQHRFGEGPRLTAVVESATVRSGDLGEDRRWVRSGPEIRRHGIHSALALPLISGPRVLAVVSVYSYSRNAFRADAVILAELFAGPASTSVANAVALTQPGRR